MVEFSESTRESLKLRLLSLCVCIFLRTQVYAGLNSGASFLKIDPGAKPASMASAYTAVTGDLNSIYFNPAGLSGFDQQEFGGTHAQYLAGSQYDFISFAQPTSMGAFGVSMTRLATPMADGRDANRQSTGGFSDVDTAYSLAFSRPLSGLGFGGLDSGVTSLGVNVKYVQSQIASYKSSAFAFDIGAIHRMGALPMTIGMSVMNMGRPMQFLNQADPLP